MTLECAELHDNNYNKYNESLNDFKIIHESHDGAAASSVRDHSWSTIACLQLSGCKIK